MAGQLASLRAADIAGNIAKIRSAADGATLRTDVRKGQTPDAFEELQQAIRQAGRKVTLDQALTNDTLFVTVGEPRLQLCSGDGEGADVAYKCHLAEEPEDGGLCDHTTTWTNGARLDADTLTVTEAQDIAAMYGGTWDEDSEEHGMAAALLVLSQEVSNQRNRARTIAEALGLSTQQEPF